MEAVISVQNVNKIFDTGIQKIHILKDVSVEIEKGKFTLIVGPSGCGKSTLLHTMIGLEEPTSGKVFFEGKDLYKLSPDERCDLRKSRIGIIQQQSNWIKSLNVWENVAIPLILWGYSQEMSQHKALVSLKEIGMKEWYNYSPVELSSGQQQKVALARAITNDAPTLIADEPTGNLDHKSSDDLIRLTKKLVEEKKRTVIMVSHEIRFKKHADRIIEILDGKII